MESNCYLTDEHKATLKIIATGLKSGDVKTVWSDFRVSYGKITSIIGVKKSFFTENLSERINQSVLDKFVQCGYFWRQGMKKFTLNDGKIIHDAKINFGDGEQMLLSQSAKDTAKYLVQELKSKNIDRTIGLLDVTAGNDNRRRFQPISGVHDSNFILPDFDDLQELASKKLINIIRNDNIEVFILEDLVNAVENDFGHKDKLNPTELHITPEHEIIIGNLVNDIASLNPTEFQLIKLKQNNARMIAKQIFGTQSDFYADLTPNIVKRQLSLNELKSIVNGMHAVAKIEISKVIPTRISIDSSIFGEPLTSPQFLVDIFMVMPFKDELKPIYEQHIKNTVQQLRLSIKRGDEVFGGHFIPKEIYSLTYNSKLVIADCTGQNANVYYELGIAHMLDKKVIIISQNEEDIRFDVNQMRYIIYDPQNMKPFLAELKQAIHRLLSDSGSTIIADLF